MNIMKVSFASSFETAIKLISGFLVLKFLAITAGPAGVGKFGQFQNFLTIVTVLVSGSFVTGLVRFISESSDKVSTKSAPNEEHIRYMSGAITFGVLVSLILTITLYLLADTLSIYVFNTDEFETVFYLVGPSLFFIVAYQVSVAYLNGIREIKALILVKLVASLSLLIVGSALIYCYGLYGSLVGLILMQTLAGIFSIKVLLALPSFSWQWFKLGLNKRVQLNLSPYWLMSLTSLISSAVVMVLIRKHIAIENSWVTAGLWDALWKISELSMLLVTTALTVYYVPMLSRADTVKQQITLLLNVSILGVFMASLISLVLYLMRELVVTLLFSDSFISISEIMGFQLIGAVLRIVGWVIGFHMIIKSKPRYFIFAEIVFGGTFYVLSLLFFNEYGVVGLTYAFVINNLMFLFVGGVYLLTYFKRFEVVNG